MARVLSADPRPERRSVKNNGIEESESRATSRILRRVSFEGEFEDHGEEFNSEVVDVGPSCAHEMEHAPRAAPATAPGQN